MRTKILLFMIIALSAITLLSCKTAPREEQPVLRQPETDIGQPRLEQEEETAPGVSHDTLPSPDESPLPETTEEPGEEQPANADNYYMLGQTLYNTGHYEDAASAFKETLAIQLHYDRARYDLARSYLMLDDHEAALKEYKILLKSDPDMADALRQAAVTMVSLNPAYKFIMQVGAFRHVNNAKYLIDDLKENHLFVYMKENDGLYKVLIHGIRTIKEGNLIMNEIKKKHDIQPFLIISE